MKTKMLALFFLSVGFSSTDSLASQLGEVSQITTPELGALIRILEDPLQASAASTELQRLGPSDEVAQAIIRALEAGRFSEESPRYWAYAALKTAMVAPSERNTSAGAIDRFLAGLQDSSYSIRVLAARALSRVQGDEKNRVIESLHAAIERDPAIGVNAIYSLVMLGATDRPELQEKSVEQFRSLICNPKKELASYWETQSRGQDPAGRMNLEILVRCAAAKALALVRGLDAVLAIDDSKLDARGKIAVAAGCIASLAQSGAPDSKDPRLVRASGFVALALQSPEAPLALRLKALNVANHLVIAPGMTEVIVSRMEEAVIVASMDSDEKLRESAIRTLLNR